MKLMPQEIEVWYLIPAIRKELTKIFLSDLKISQKKISEILGVSEGAISQYLNSKRGSELKFSRKEKEEIKKTAKKIIKNKKSHEELYKLSIKLKGCDSLCEWHKKHD